MRNTPLWQRALAAVIAVLLAGGITIALVDTDGDGRNDGVSVDRDFRTVADPPGPAAPVVVDADNELEPDEQAEARKSPADLKGNLDLHEDARDETPPGVTQQEVDQGREKTEALAEKVLTDPEPPAGAQAYSCPDAFVRNRSAVNGPRVGTALHFTVSDPGSLGAIRNLFDTPAFGASSNFGIELSGRCQTWVPRAEKAWAQGAGNSAYFSIEIVTKDRSRESWLAAPIIKQGILAALVRDLNRSIGAPLKRVDPVGCVWTPGIVDHDALECGNTHWDVGENFPWDVFIKQVRQGVCGLKCQRRRDLRKRHTATHRELTNRRCAPASRTRSSYCRLLHARNTAIHRAARRERIRL